MNHPLRYFLELDEQRLAIRQLAGTECMSAPYRFEARLPLEIAEMPDPDGLVRAPAAVVIAGEHGLVRRVEGIVTSADVAVTARGGELTVVIEPSLALLRHRRDMRIFRDKTAVDIVVEVAAGLGVRVEPRLSGSYAVRGYCVQMRESDLDFVQRLLEDEGIAYFVSDDGGLVLCDGPGSHPELAGGGLPFRAASQLEGHEEALFEVSERAAVTAGRVSLSDFNPDHPSLPMEVSAEVPGSSGPELYDYPGEYLDPADGQQKAQRLAEALHAHSLRIRGKSSSGRLAHGHILAAEGAPIEGPWLITRVEHQFDRDESGFTNAFDAVPSSVVWRPARVTPEPQLPNPMTAVVTGPPGADMHTNEIGRVKIHFPWDRLQPKDDRCSDWVPVLQDNTGESVALPRVGWEVLVGFLEGDPDRPVVMGRLYNGADPFPEPLPEGKTRSALRSLSSPSRAGLNMLRFDDAAGSERVTVHAERDQNVDIAHDRREDVGVRHKMVVGRDEVLEVGADQLELVGNNRTLDVTRDQTLTVGGDRKLAVAGSRLGEVGGDHSLSVGASHSRRIETDDVVQAKSLTETVAAAIVETSLETNTVSAGKAGTLTVGGALVELARKSKGESAKLGRVETIGGLLCSRSTKATTQSSKGHTTNVGGALSITATGDVTFDAGTALQMNATMAQLTHPESITLKVGGTSVVLTQGVIAITAPGKIVFRMSGEAQQMASESAQI